jgi:ABC-type phosphate transport system substrate-binding protein
LGLFDYGAIHAQKLPLHMLVLDGHEPTLESFQAGRYPYAETLSFITKAGVPRPAELSAFFAFARSPAGIAALRSAGYAPPPSTTETCH